MASRRGAVVIGGIVAIAALAWFARPAESERPDADPPEPRERPEHRAPPPFGAPEEPPAAPRPAPQPSMDAPAQDEPRARARLRQQILARHRSRAHVAEAAPRGDAPATATTGLRARVDGHDELLAELNRDFMPLAGECIDQARGRDPELAGMLAVGFSVIVDEELGAVVDAVEFPERNQVDEPELQACVRESLISMLLPPGAASGSEALLLTLPVGEGDAAGE